MYYANTVIGVDLSLTTGTAVQGSDIDTIVDVENVTGSHGNDAIEGDAGDNRLYGFSGDDTLTGLTGADTFFFEARKTSQGNDVVTDFVIGEDKVWVFAGSTVGLTSLADLNAQQVGSDVLFETTNGATVTLQNINLGDLSDSDFIF